MECPPKQTSPLAPRRVVFDLSSRFAALRGFEERVVPGLVGRREVDAEDLVGTVPASAPFLADGQVVRERMEHHSLVAHRALDHLNTRRRLLNDSVPTTSAAASSPDPPSGFGPAPRSRSAARRTRPDGGSDDPPATARPRTSSQRAASEGGAR